MTVRFLNHERFENIRAKVADGIEPFASAHAELLKAAEEALDAPAPSIQQNGGSPYFRQDAAYVPGQDGVKNTEANHESSRLASEFSRLSFDLAVAWKLTDEEKYADRALELIHCWCLNQNSKMFPTGRVDDHRTDGLGYGGDIVMFGSLHRSFLAMYLLDDYGGWDIRAHAATRRWVRRMVDPQRELMFYNGIPMYNNWEDARLLYLACGALFLHDLALLIEVFRRWREIIPVKMTDEGELPRETMRTKSMHYTLFALHSTTFVAEIAKACGEDLYGYEFNGKCLKKALDYAAGYLLDMEKWPFQMLQPLEAGKESAAFGTFEMAHAHWGDRRYLEVLGKWPGRPVHRGRETLLFGR